MLLNSAMYTHRVKEDEKSAVREKGRKGTLDGGLVEESALGRGF